MKVSSNSEYNFELSKKEYREFCTAGNHDIQVFAMPWFLDAACKHIDDWRVILYKENDKIVAAFPFQYLTGKHGIHTISNPFQAKRLGVWIDYGKRTGNREREEFENRIVQYIVENLPPFDVFKMGFDSRFKNWRALYNNGFHQETHYSYIVRKEVVTDDYLFKISKSRKREIQQLLPNTEVITTSSYNDFWEFFTYTYKQRKRTLSYREEQLEKLMKVAIEKNAVTIYLARNKDGRITATEVLFKDNKRSYSMFTSYDPNEKVSSRVLLTYQCILDSASENIDYDFEGSMIPGVAQYNRWFNPELEPFFYITKYSLKAKLMENIKESISIIKKLIKESFR